MCAGLHTLSSVGRRHLVQSEYVATGEFLKLKIQVTRMIILYKQQLKILRNRKINEINKFGVK